MHKQNEDPEAKELKLNHEADEHLSKRHNTNIHFDKMINLNKCIVFLHKGIWSRNDLREIFQRHFLNQRIQVDENSVNGQACIIGAGKLC